MATTDDFIEAGLYDPDTSMAGRLELLEWLDAEGFSIAEMQDAKRSLAIGAMMGDLRLASSERIDIEQAMEISGLDAERLDVLATAFGFAEIERVWGAGDGPFSVREAEVMALLDGVAEMFSGEEVISFVRVIGGAFARIADAAVSLFLNDVESDMLSTGASEIELARKVYEAIGLLDGVGELFDPVLRRHMLQAVQRSRHALIDENERFNYRYAVGFIDLVGFTELSGNFDARELGVFIRDFEGRAHDVVTNEGARVVKLIGDEIMFAATDVDAACRAAGALMEGFASADERVLPRGGVAYGDVLVRGGDFYGPVVNLASRLVDEAVPQEVLVTDDVAQSASASTFEPAGRRMVKGFAAPVSVHSLHR